MTRYFVAATLLLVFLLTAPLKIVAAGLGTNPPNPVASITDVSLSSVSHVAGNAAVLQVTIRTLNVSNGTAVVARLVRSDLNPVDGVEATATIQNNQAVGTLSLPGSLTAGGYLVVVSISSLGLSDDSSAYSVLQPAQATITAVTLSHATGTAGALQNITVDISTASVENGTVANISLVDGTGATVDAVAAQAVISSNTAQALLTMPASLVAGVYRVKVEVAGLVDDSTVYTALEAGQQNVAPEARNVRVSGLSLVGFVLTGQYDYYDADNDSEGVSSLRWYRSATLAGNRNLVGTQRTYTLTAADEGRYLWFEVEPVASQGVLRGERVASAPVGPIAGFLLGDVNGDGYVNAADMVPIIRHTLGIELITCPRALAAADVNGDGNITVADVVDINLHVLGIVSLP